MAKKIYTTLVESLRRLYGNNSKYVTLKKLKSMLEENKITQEEYDYIVSVKQ